MPSKREWEEIGDIFLYRETCNAGIETVLGKIRVAKTGLIASTKASGEIKYFDYAGLVSFFSETVRQYNLKRAIKKAKRWVEANS
jgi:hypothetical protein